MTGMIRCTSCKGSKKLYKLGGILGDCGLCNATGRIKECDKPLPPMSNYDDVYGCAVISEHKIDIISATARAVPGQIEPFESKPAVNRKVFKRKKG